MKRTIGLLLAALLLMPLALHASAASVPEDMILYFAFDEASGKDLIDGKGGNKLTLDRESRRVEGRIGSGAVSFDGSTDQVLQTNSGMRQDLTLINTGNAFTVSLWVRFEAGQAEKGDQTLIGWGAATDYVRLFVQGGSQNLGLQTAGGYPYAFNHNPDVVGEDKAILLLDSDEWHHIAVIYDGAAKKVTFLIDGRTYEGIPSPETDWADTSYSIEAMKDWFTLGSMNDKSTANFKGMMDDVRVYDRVLREEELLALMKLGTPQEPEPDTPAVPETLDAFTAALAAVLGSGAAAAVFRRRR